MFDQFKSKSLYFKVCISDITINGKRPENSFNAEESGFWMNKYVESCSYDFMATSTIKIKNSIIISDYCLISRQLLFNGNFIFDNICSNS